MITMTSPDGTDTVPTDAQGARVLRALGWTETPSTDEAQPGTPAPRTATAGGNRATRPRTR
ncbi:hypothetical protein M8C13_06240 [Crossiella sp. SN42]|uniref:hypothetical protein n=1 Tax=Crossiella sp. SN42 TaxID=2944808 RepID=UPI00207CBFAD|nr:hypothetical protein [Crossiella sp. SN42]MCO1575359.1 hypothetical protein [Crossiella sp. SN42]